MKFEFLVHLFLPVIVYGHIRVKIKAAKTAEESAVQYTGSNIEIISDKDIEAFQLDDRNLKEACTKLTHGTKPRDVYVKSPTPWGDIYKIHKWKQVQRVLKAVSGRVLGVHTKPVMVASREFVNYSKKNKAKFNAGISHFVEETITNTWSRGGELTLGQEITYEVKFATGSAGGTTSLSYENNWHNETSKTSSVTLGTTTNVEVELSPGQGAVATLTATFGTLDIEVDYEGYLEGFVFANFHEKWQRHNYWGFPIDRVQYYGGLKQKIDSTEQISIGFYSGARVEVHDKETNAKIAADSAGVISNGSKRTGSRGKGGKIGMKA